MVLLAFAVVNSTGALDKKSGGIHCEERSCRACCCHRGRPAASEMVEIALISEHSSFSTSSRRVESFLAPSMQAISNTKASQRRPREALVSLQRGKFRQPVQGALHEKCEDEGEVSGSGGGRRNSLERFRCFFERWGRPDPASGLARRQARRGLLDALLQSLEQARARWLTGTGERRRGRRVARVTN